jgi:hypothetical protein
VADWSIRCNTAEHRSLEVLGYWLLALWPIGVPATYALLLALCGRSIRTERLSPLAGYVRFLWTDFRPRFFFWELVQWRGLGCRAGAGFAANRTAPDTGFPDTIERRGVRVPRETARTDCGTLYTVRCKT